MTCVNQTKVIEEASRIQEDATYSSKGHFNAAEDLSCYHTSFGIISVIAGVIATIKAFVDTDGIDWFAGIFALIAAVSSGLSTFMKYEERAQKHHNAGNLYLELKNKTRIFKEVELTCLDNDTIINKLNDLSASRDQLNISSPLIPRRAYEKAVKGIQSGEAKHEVDGA